MARRQGMGPASRRPGSPAGCSSAAALSASGGCEGAELGQQVTRVPLHECAQLGRARHAPGGGERLGELVRGEEPQRPPVDPLPDRCVPRAPASCCPGRPPAATVTGRTWTKATSISSSSPSRTMRLPGLMSRWAMPGVPQLADQQQPLVDHARRRCRPRRSRSRPAKNSVTSMYSRSGVISTTP